MACWPRPGPWTESKTLYSSTRLSCLQVLQGHEGPVQDRSGDQAQAGGSQGVHGEDESGQGGSWGWGELSWVANFSIIFENALLLFQEVLEAARKMGEEEDLGTRQLCQSTLRQVAFSASA